MKKLYTTLLAISIGVILGSMMLACSPSSITKETQIEAALIPLVDAGLAVAAGPSGPVIAAVNDAGAKAIIALQTDYANKTGVTLDQAKQVTDAATLGLTVSGNGKAASYVKALAPSFDSTVSNLTTTVPIAH